jgi:hypothetical protein
MYVLNLNNYLNRSTFIRNIKIRFFYAPEIRLNVFQRTGKLFLKIIYLTGRPRPRYTFVVIAEKLIL